MKKILSAVLSLALTAGSLLPLTAGAAEYPAVSQMSLRDKLTQMLMVDLTRWDEDPTDDTGPKDLTQMNPQVAQLLADYRFGSVILFAANLTGTEQTFSLVSEMQQAAAESGGIPLLICTDQEGGSVYRLSTGTALPGNMALGAAADPSYGLMAGRILGSELQALGINGNLAPVVDVNSNPANPVIGLRSFSDDPETVGQLASSLITGMAQFSVASCAKHFPGHGDTATDSHYGLPRVDKTLAQLEACELIPFRTVIEAGVDMVMTAHILYPRLEETKVFSRKTGREESLPATMSPRILTELLKEDMNFSGIVVTDAMNMAGVTGVWDPVQAAVLAVQAGADMLCMPCSLQSSRDIPRLEAILQGLEQAVEEGTIPLSRIDDAVTRILRVKEKRGILSRLPQSPDRALSVVGCDANREAERHMAAAAVTVVKNENNTLPLRLTSQSRVLMLVPYSNEQAQMILGWNRAAEAGLIPEGAQVRVVRFDKNSTPDTFRQELDWADTLIFNSEISRPERLGGGRWESAFILSVLEASSGKTAIVQSVDTPYDVQSYEKADAVLAVYGCKGSSLDPTQALMGGTVNSEAAFGPNIVAGIEVIFGVFGAEGTLPVDIPKYENNSFTDQILYPRGYGLFYSSLIPEPEIPHSTEPLQTESPTPVPAPETTVPSVPSEEFRPIRWVLPAVLWGGLALLVAVSARKRKKRRKRG